MTTEKKVILIIDDDARNIFALSLVLRSKGYSVVSASDAETGIMILKENNLVGIALLDMMMPEMDGYQALQVIRNTEGIKDFPVIAVTAQAMKGDKERCLEAGATDYISKPINMDELEAKLKQFLI
ncbi:response regulator [Taibaiella lutea]|uniref:Response regulator n=1 Tax=Taibaiella lutea TaxID=2608001 RepID=A0A5M6CAF7_9BACT|nr:response regulator [Taibaiella lutea]KAA5532157.1 response regulator [Taibaiella lutea]